MDDCFYDLAIALGMSKNSPYRASINRKIGQLREGGFIHKWMKAGDKNIEMKNEARKDTPFTLEQLQGPFFIHGLVLIISLMAFIWEFNRTSYLQNRATAKKSKKKANKENDNNKQFPVGYI